MAYSKKKKKEKNWLVYFWHPASASSIAFVSMPFIFSDFFRVFYWKFYFAINLTSKPLALIICLNFFFFLAQFLRFLFIFPAFSLRTFVFCFVCLRECLRKKLTN